MATASLRPRKASHQWVGWVNLKASLSVAATVATRARSLVVSMFRAGNLATTTLNLWLDRPLDSAAGCCHPPMPVGSKASDPVLLLRELMLLFKLLYYCSAFT